jgi:hypothetical protein
VHRWSILINVQRDVTQSSLFIILQAHSTCFECQPHPSAGVHKTVTTASGTGPATSLQRGQANLATLEGGSCTNNVTSAGGCSYSFVYFWLTTLEGGSCTKNVTSTGGCSYSFVYSWLAMVEGGSCTKKRPVPEAVVTVLCIPDDGCGWHSKHVQWTCRIINRLLCVASRWTTINIALCK